MKSFNNVIVKHRGKPIYTMLEEIRKLVGNRFDKRFEMAASWEGKATPFVARKLKLMESDARNCSSIFPAGRGECDVVEGTTNFSVKLNEHYCNCKK